ncbi:hypothetical protein F5148DRAFT_1201424 [Russula earlei]|uniref:Uncharacterized protein n=1 Tax=Russula earlei TaxID=71964 RepID=A0ACC0U806_9AGAM|nr:hypothetical protein F5148DRAFT_1201424 [Russula earlei]
MAAQRLLAWPKETTSEARKIILGVIKSHNAPISSRELFEKAVKVPAPPRENGEQPLTPWARHLRNSKPAPPYPDHPIRSLKYLKGTVLENLVRTGDIKKVHVKRVLSPEEIERRKATMSKAQLRKTSDAALAQPVSAWLWQLVDESRGRSSSAGTTEEDEKAVGGAGEDWGHLNRRRRRARGDKVKRDVKWMERVERARRSEE